MIIVIKMMTHKLVPSTIAQMKIMKIMKKMEMERKVVAMVMKVIILQSIAMKMVMMMAIVMMVVMKMKTSFYHCIYTISLCK